MSLQNRWLAGALALCVLGTAHSKLPETSLGAPVGPNEASEKTSAHPDLLRFLFQSVEDPQQLRGYRIAILVSDGVDGFDLAIPQRFLTERGASVHVIGPRPKLARTAGSGPVTERSTQISVLNPSGEEDVADVDRFLDQVRAGDYDAIYLPGNRALSRELEDMPSERFLQQAVHAGKPIFATGNAALTLLAAGLLEQRRATGDAATLERLAASSAYATDAALVIDGPIYTSRDAFDMPALMERLVGRLLAQPPRVD